ncbi:MAG: hypothetical protein ACI8RD_011087, partial [Bacillariaceae sp.]
RVIYSIVPQICKCEYLSKVCDGSLPNRLRIPYICFEKKRKGNERKGKERKGKEKRVTGRNDETNLENDYLLEIVSSQREVMLC